MPRGAARIPRDFTCTRRAKLTREIVAQPLVSSPGPVTDKSRPIRVNVAKSVPSPSRSHSRKSVSPSRSRWQFPSNWKLLPWIESVSPSNKLNFLFSLFTLSFWLLSFSFFFFSTIRDDRFARHALESWWVILIFYFRNDRQWFWFILYDVTDRICVNLNLND